MKKNNKLKELKQLKRLLTLSLVASMPFSMSACGKEEGQEPTTQVQIEETTFEEDNIQEDSEMVKNDTIDYIINQYNQKSNKNIDESDIFVEKFDSPMYIWNKEGENYIYDYRFNNTDNPGYSYSDPGYFGKMYAVILKNDEGGFEPISALAYIDNKIVNVKVTYYYDKTDYEPSSNYIIINNPTKDDLNNIKNADDYSKLDNNKLLLTKNN